MGILNKMAKKGISGKKIIRVTILTAAVIMMAAGLLDGDYRDVFSKAVMICMECIGIG